MEGCIFGWLFGGCLLLLYAEILKTRTNMFQTRLSFPLEETDDTDDTDDIVYTDDTDDTDNTENTDDTETRRGRPL